MNRFGWSSLVAVTAATAVGLAAGWYAGRQTSPTGDPHEHPEHEHPEGEVQLAPETLRALGVTVAPVTPGTHAGSIAVPAMVVAPPQARLPVPAPIGGRVERTDCVLGAAIRGGDALVTIVREPLPVPELRVAGEVVRPAQEELHQMVVELRRAQNEVAIARAEYERVAASETGGDEPPLLPRQVVLQRRYELERAERLLESARHEMERHGIEAEQIDAVAAGAELPAFEAERWRRALERSGLFGAAARELLQALPEELRTRPLAVAVAAELVATSLAGPDLVTWLRDDPGAGADFLALGTLLQRGHSVADLQRMHDLGALAPVFTLRAPDGEYDVEAILVSPLAQVEAGHPLVVLADPRELLLEATPAGGDAAALLAAWQRGAECVAEPAFAGGGPRLAGLRILRVRSDAEHATVGLLALQNEPLPAPSGAQRSWQLRPGTRYVLRLPHAQHEQVAVLPAAAVARDGVADVVFRETATGLMRMPVEVVTRDGAQAIVALREGAELRAGDRIAQAGAFGLLLALRGGGEAGHHHDH